MRKSYARYHPFKPCHAIPNFEPGNSQDVPQDCLLAMLVILQFPFCVALTMLHPVAVFRYVLVNPLLKVSLLQTTLTFSRWRVILYLPVLPKLEFDGLFGGIPSFDILDTYVSVEAMFQLISASLIRGHTAMITIGMSTRSTHRHHVNINYNQNRTLRREM